ncbi:hypothetical protein P3T21_004737 [Paraburkholderia sp. GAS334]
MDRSKPVTEVREVRADRGLRSLVIGQVNVTRCYFARHLFS